MCLSAKVWWDQLGKSLKVATPQEDTFLAFLVATATFSTSRVKRGSRSVFSFGLFAAKRLKRFSHPFFPLSALFLSILNWKQNTCKLSSHFTRRRSLPRADKYSPSPCLATRNTLRVCASCFGESNKNKKENRESSHYRFLFLELARNLERSSPPSSFYTHPKQFSSFRFDFRSRRMTVKRPISTSLAVEEKKSRPDLFP